jgi:hypothetical protein
LQRGSVSAAFDRALLLKFVIILGLGLRLNNLFFLIVS